MISTAKIASSSATEYAHALIHDSKIGSIARLSDVLQIKHELMSELGFDSLDIEDIQKHLSSYVSSGYSMV